MPSTVSSVRADEGGGGRHANDPIAIIGVTCRFPSAQDVEAFWHLIREGRDAICKVPPSRWDIDAVYDPDPAALGKMYTRWGGFLDDLEQFDTRFFGISLREANQMNPQHRLLLEVTWEALERAGQGARPARRQPHRCLSSGSRAPTTCSGSSLSSPLTSSA